MKDKTATNVHTAFVGEAKANQRLLVFARKAEAEDLPQIAHLFRAVAAAEGVHSRRHFAILESVADTQTNLERAFQSEMAVNGVHYPEMLRDAEEDGEEAATLVFSQAGDVEAEHAQLCKMALNHLITQTSTEYYVCNVCGHISEARARKLSDLRSPKFKIRKSPITLKAFARCNYLFNASDFRILFWIRTSIESNFVTRFSIPFFNEARKVI